MEPGMTPVVPASGAKPGLATAALREEHEVIRRALDVLERVGRRLADGERVNRAGFRELVGLLRTFVDECHHGKEEGFLFPAMVEKGAAAAGPAAAVLAGHHEGREFLAALSGQRSPAETAAAVLSYVQVMRVHIDREHEVLFPLADALFTPDEHLHLARCYEKNELFTFGPGLRERLVAALGRLDAPATGPRESLS
jgi:hemerythrin-like domain-containing protein